MDSTVFWTAAGAMAAVLTFGIALIGFWLRFNDRINQAESKADIAEERGMAALKSASELHNRLTVEASAFGLFREKVAANYVPRDMLREMEDRIMSAFRDSARVTAGQIEGLSDRIDKVLGDRPPGPR